MRDFDRVREKIEIRLEPRQVVGLAAVTALFCGALFAGGYVLGSRQGGNVGGAALDRLAAIDAFGGPRAEAPTGVAPATEALGEVEFMFPSALGARPARHRAVVKPVRLPEQVVAEPAGPAPVLPVELDPAVAPPPEEVAEAPKPRPKAEPKPEPKAEPRAEPRAAPRSEARAERPRPVAPIEPRAERVAPAAPRSAAPLAVRPVDHDPLPDLDEDVPDRGNRHAEREPAAGRYTVQLKTAQEREAAAAYAEELRRAGYEPRIVLAGGTYRVHLGQFESREAARSFQRRFRQDSGRADAGFVTEL